MIRKLVIVPAAAAILTASGAWAQTRVAAPAATDQYIERQRQRLDQDLQRRLEDIERRYEEEKAFRAGQKDQRLEFERKLVKDKRAFLESLRRIKLADRTKALEAFYARQRDKRKEFNDRRRAESRSFWEARAAQRRGAPPRAQGR